MDYVKQFTIGHWNLANVLLQSNWFSEMQFENMLPNSDPRLTCTDVHGRYALKTTFCERSCILKPNISKHI